MIFFFWYYTLNIWYWCEIAWGCLLKTFNIVAPYMVFPFHVRVVEIRKWGNEMSFPLKLYVRQRSSRSRLKQPSVIWFNGVCVCKHGHSAAAVFPLCSLFNKYLHMKNNLHSVFILCPAERHSRMPLDDLVIICICIYGFYMVNYLVDN